MSKKHRPKERFVLNNLTSESGRDYMDACWYLNKKRSESVEEKAIG